MFFSFFCSLIHILICNIGFHFFHTRLKSWNTQLNNFDCNFEAVRRRCVKTHRRRTVRVKTAASIIFYVHPHTGTATLHATVPQRSGSVFCTWYLYKNRLYIMIYWEKETICKIRHSAPPIARMEWSCVLPTIRLWDWQIRLLRSNPRIVDYSGSPLLILAM